jgi:hypothetical protein
MHWKNLYHATCSGPLITKVVFIKGIFGAVRENVTRGEIVMRFLMGFTMRTQICELIAHICGFGGGSAINCMILRCSRPSRD